MPGCHIDCMRRLMATLLYSVQLQQGVTGSSNESRRSFSLAITIDNLGVMVHGIQLSSIQ